MARGGDKDNICCSSGHFLIRRVRVGARIPTLLPCANSIARRIMRYVFPHPMGATNKRWHDGATA